MTDFTGFASAHDYGDDFAQLHFVVKQLMRQQATATIVRVIAVTNNGGLSPVGYLDVLPMVHQVDGMGQSVPHGPLHNLPYFRLQGGQNAVIMDPAVGDIGLAVFASRDISKVKNTKADAVPGSKRVQDMADGLYIGGFLNGTPAQYIRFDSSGDIHLKPASTVYVDGDVEVTGEVTAGGIPLTTHKHTGVTPGGGETGIPTT